MICFLFFRFFHTGPQYDQKCVNVNQGLFVLILTGYAFSVMQHAGSSFGHLFLIIKDAVVKFSRSCL